MRFTAALSRDDVFDVKPPTLCCAEFIFESKAEIHLGIVLRKQVNTTLESRLTFSSFLKIEDDSFSVLAKSHREWLVAEDDGTPSHQGGFTNGGIRFKVPSASECDSLLRFLHDLNPQHLQSLISEIQPAATAAAPVWQQKDAIKLALAAFGLNPGETIQFEESKGSEEVHLLEDYVIWDQSSRVPGYDLIESDCTGHRVFKNGDERLDVFTANKGPLESMLGVDLIYINDVLGNSVMIQYKMLEYAPNRTKSNWIFRPDEQFSLEHERMHIPAIQDAKDDFRLNNSPFFFQFVKRRSGAVEPQSFIVSKDHLTTLLSSDSGRGPKGGVRISYEALKGSYLRRSDLIALIRSGYIGTHRVETTALRTLIEAAASGNRGVVLAWQRITKKPDPVESELSVETNM